MMLQGQWKDERQQLEEFLLDTGLWALGHKISCQVMQMWSTQKLIGKNQLMVRLKVLTFELGPHQQMRILYRLMKGQTISLRFQNFYADL